MNTRILILFCMVALNSGISANESSPSVSETGLESQNLPSGSNSDGDDSSNKSNSESLPSATPSVYTMPNQSPMPPENQALSAQAQNSDISSAKSAESAPKSPTDGLQLKNVFLTFRSHEHTATDYPKGPNITGIPETKSQLTEKGKNYAYSFGKYLRENYTSLFSGKTFNESDLYCMGTTTRRTQESALFVEAGLLGKKMEETEWTTEKGEKHLFNKTELYIKFYNKAQCPAFYNAVAEEVPELLKKVKKYTKTVEEVKKKYDDVSEQDPATVWLAYETFGAMNAEGKPETNLTWLNDTMWQDLKHFSEQFIYTTESTDKTKKLSGGVMVEGLLSKFEIKDESEKQKMESSMRPMSLLAAPQAVLGAMIGAFSPEGTKYNGSEFNAENFYPGNGSYHVFEYYENKTDKGKHFRVLYTPKWETPLMPLIYTGCTSDGICTLQQLQNALKDVRLKVQDQDKECKRKQDLLEIIKDALSDLLTSLLEKFNLNSIFGT